MDCSAATTSSDEPTKEHIIVRIVVKASLCTQYDASVFHIIANSTEHGTVYLVAYGATADHFYAKLEEKKIYQIDSAYEKAILGDANQQYSDRPSYRFKLKGHTVVKEIKNNTTIQFAIPKGIYYTPIAYTKLTQYIKNNQPVDVIAVYMHSDGGPVEHTRADRTTTVKRTVVIEMDGGDHSLSLILWGGHAEAFRQPEPGAKGDKKHVIGLKNVTVKDAGQEQIELWSSARTTIQWDAHAMRGN